MNLIQISFILFFSNIARGFFVVASSFLLTCQLNLILLILLLLLLLVILTLLLLWLLLLLHVVTLVDIFLLIIRLLLWMLFLCRLRILLGYEILKIFIWEKSFWLLILLSISDHLNPNLLLLLLTIHLSLLWFR